MNHVTTNEYQESSYLRAYKAPSTTVEKALQISPFLINKANFRKSQVNVKSIHTVVYENKSNWTLGENKPNQTQFKPIKANFKPKQTQSPSAIRNTQYEIRDTNPNKPNLGTTPAGWVTLKQGKGKL